MLSYYTELRKSCMAHALSNRVTRHAPFKVWVKLSSVFVHYWTIIFFVGVNSIPIDDKDEV